MSLEVVDITEIMKDVKSKAAKREWREIPITFEEFRESEDDGIRSFVEDEFREKVHEFQETCWVNYDTPIAGKCKVVKKNYKKIIFISSKVTLAKTK